MFKWTHHSFKHVSVHADVGACDAQFYTLAELTRGLPSNVSEPGGLSRKCNHACAHQAFLQACIYTCLLLQYSLRLSRESLQIDLNRGEVVQAFTKAARKLL